jgi:predicted ester cyclase
MILKDWYEQVWNQNNEAAVDEFLAPDVIIHNLLAGDGEKTMDLATFKRLFRAMRSELSEVQVTTEHELVDGDMIAARCVISAIHHDVGPDELPREVPIHFTGMSMVKVREGKIIESWNHFDFEGMYQQME